MNKETRFEKMEREHREMVARVLARHAAGAAALPHKKG